jgi:hypothetical protein
MSEDVEVEVTEQSWGGRLWSSIKGVGLGFLLFVGSFYLLFWNEGRSLQTYQSLDEGLGAVVSISDSELHDNNDGKLVHISGTATSEGELQDEQFDLAVSALQLFRRTETYQWQETKEEKTEKKLGGGTKTITKYRYNKAWSSQLIDSSKFHTKDQAKTNPSKLRFESKSFTAPKVQIGAFTLPSDMVADIDNSSKVDATEANIPEEFKDDMNVSDGVLYWGDEQNPVVGDVKISFLKTPATEVTVVAKQSDGSFGPFQTKAGDELQMLKAGKFTAAEMFKDAKSQNSMMTWILRVVGIVAMIAGLKLMVGPMEVMMDFIPILGSIVQLGVTLVSVVIGTCLSLFTIGIAWVSYRPLVGIPLLLVAVGGLFVLFKKRSRKPRGEEPNLDTADESAD